MAGEGSTNTEQQKIPASGKLLSKNHEVNVETKLGEHYKKDGSTFFSYIDQKELKLQYIRTYSTYIHTVIIQYVQCIHTCMSPPPPECLLRRLHIRISALDNIGNQNNII